MPISSSLLTSSIVAQMVARRVIGRNAKGLAAAVGGSLARYLKTPNLATAYVSGTAGPLGTVVTVATLGLVPTAMSSLMVSRAATVGFRGEKMKSVYDGISIGVSTVLQTMILRGTVAGCAVGAGTARFQAANQSTYKQLLESQMRIRGLRGRDKGKLADIIAFGIINHLLASVTFTVTVAGAIAPTPPTGPVAVASIPSISTRIV